MPISQPTFKPSSSSTSNESSTPTTTNLSMGTPDSEESHALVSGLKQLHIRSRIDATLKYAFETGESGTNYTTLEPGVSLSLDGLNFTSKTLYIQSDTITTLEILELST